MRISVNTQEPVYPWSWGWGSSVFPLTSIYSWIREGRSYFRTWEHIQLSTGMELGRWGCLKTTLTVTCHCPGSQRCLTFAGETFDVEMLGLDPKHFPFARPLHIYGSEWQASLTGGESLEGGPLKKKTRKDHVSESIPIKGVTVGGHKYAHNFVSNEPHIDSISTNGAPVIMS